MKKQPTFLQGLSTVVALFLFIFVGYAILKIRIEPLLIACATYAGFIALRLGYTWKEMETFITQKIKKAMPAIFILISVGTIIGTWIYSGTVPMLIYYGLKIINPKFFLVSAFLITAIISTVTGTSWGSAGTAGVALIGIATGLGIPLPQAAGAIISGAVFGDKMSPLSDTTNMAAISTGTDLYDHIRHMLYTTVPASIVGLIVWFIVGLKGIGQEAVLPGTVNALTDALDLIYNWNILLLLPAVIVFYGAVTKKPTVPVMLISSFVALVIGTFVQGFDIVKGLSASVVGFNVNMINVPGFDPATAPKAIHNLLNRGGMMSMADMVIIIFCAMAYAGIVQDTGCLEVILKSFEKKIKSTGQLIVSTIVSCIVMVSAVGHSSITAIFIGELFTDLYKKKGLHTKNLSRTIEDAGTMIVCLIPWSGNGLFYLATLGVSATEYWKWAVPCYLGIVFATIYGFTGFSIEKLDSDLDTKELA